MIDGSVYLGMNSAKQAMLALQITTNNLANTNSTGFRADLAQFESVPVSGPGLDSRTYSMAKPAGSDFTQGPTITTGKNLDVAINGPGWIAVQSSNGEAYTRAGNFNVSAEGLLMTAKGNYVLGNGGPISIPPSSKIDIGVDGTISIIPMGQSASSVTVIDRIKLVNPAANQLQKKEDGLFYSANGSAQADASVQLISGALEGSNVNVMGSLIDMISLQREFELSVKIMKTAEENADSASSLLRIPR